MIEILFGLGIAVFAIAMLIYTTIQGREKSKNEAEKMGEKLTNLKTEDIILQKTEEQIVKHCPDCTGNLNRDGNVYVCELCGATYSEDEI